WDISGLLPDTSYFWRVVAVRGGQSSSPVWQFTTAGVDHFEIVQDEQAQTAGEPFLVTVSAKNAVNNTVATFAGPVQLNAVFGPRPLTAFNEDFEDPLEGWS